MLLKVGRHLRPRPHFKLIVSREEGEGRFLNGYRKQFISLKTTSHGGPLALIDGVVNADDIELAARIIARYSQGRDADEVTLEFSDHGAEPVSLRVRPLGAHEILAEWHL